MKTFLVLLLFPFCSLAQPGVSNGKDITGTWQGYVRTSEKSIPYELVISVKNGNLVAYSLTTFTVNNQENISLKKVNLRFKDDEIIAEDDDVVFDNLTNDAAKKIKQTNKLKLNAEGDKWKLTGSFETKIQRVLRPAKGEVYLEKAANPNDAKLIVKLDELNMSDGLSFTPAVAVPPALPAAKPAEVQPEVVKATPPPPPPAPKVEPTPVQPAVVQPAPVQPAVVLVAAPVEEIPLTRSAFKTQLRLTPVAQQKATARITKPATTRIYIPPVPSITRSTPVVAAVPKAEVKEEKDVAATARPIPAVPSPVATAPKKATPANVAVAPALDLAKRKIETIGQVFIESDSLMLTLYDNGEVDGDSVSLVLNGKTIVSKQGLNTTAFTKTVYITPDLGDSIQLVMYAENLGSLPPNTGLLILQFDGKRQEIRFSGDLNKNAAITLRRRQRN